MLTELTKGRLRGLADVAAVMKFGIESHGPVVEVNWEEGPGVPLFKFQNGWQVAIIHGRHPTTEKAKAKIGEDFYVAARPPGTNQWKYLLLDEAVSDSKGWT